LKNNRPETQEELEELAKAFVQTVIARRPGAMNDLLHPEYVTCSLAEGTLTLAYRGADWMSNPVGVMHGGVIASVLDVTMGVQAYLLGGQVMPPTMTMQVSYLRPVPLTGRTLVRVRCDSAGRTKVALTAELWNEDRPEKRLATASGLYYVGGETVESWTYRDKTE